MNKDKELKQVQPANESLSYAVEVRDKEGRVIKRISAPSRSYVQQWNQLINTSVAFAVDTWQKKDTGGVLRTSKGWVTNLKANAAIGDVTQGTRVGKGFTPVAIDDYALETPCGEGVGVDEFNHQVVTFTVPAVVGPTCSFTIKRIMVNNSGATINGIREIGCYVEFRQSTFTRYAMGFRDVLPGAVTVPIGGSITVTYTIAATV